MVDRLDHQYTESRHDNTALGHTVTWFWGMILFSEAVMCRIHNIQYIVVLMCVLVSGFKGKGHSHKLVCVQNLQIGYV